MSKVKRKNRKEEQSPPSYNKLISNILIKQKAIRWTKRKFLIVANETVKLERLIASGITDFKRFKVDELKKLV